MLSLQFSHPRINTNKIPSHCKKINTFSSLEHCIARNKKYGSSIYDHFSPNSSPFRFHLAAAATNDSRTSGFDNIDEEKISAVEFPEGLEAELMPKHVAVILDGNRRWATNRMLTAGLGHKAGGQAFSKLAINCSKLGVKVLTVFAFSTENWIRPKEEVDFLMSFFEEVLQSDISELLQKEMNISFIGNKSRLPQSLRSLISSTEVSTRKNNGMRLVIAMNYGGRYDITEASKKIARKIRDGVLGVEDVDEALFEQHLETGGIEFPHPDLIIRTSGESRISDFMLWQLAYSELLFVKKMFPDFEEADLVEALMEFQQRKRRYGG